MRIIVVQLVCENLKKKIINLFLTLLLFRIQSQIYSKFLIC